jgi:hypothetical protein
MEPINHNTTCENCEEYHPEDELCGFENEEENK